jgi:hypothetical protein
MKYSYPAAGFAAQDIALAGNALAVNTLLFARLAEKTSVGEAEKGRLAYGAETVRDLCVQAEEAAAQPQAGHQIHHIHITSLWRFI